MRVRDHVVLSSLAAALLYPRLRRAAVVPWAAGILIDVDHYAWFCLDQHRLNPLDAVRFFNQAQPPQHQGTRRLHSFGFLLVLLLAGTRWRFARLLFPGIALHVALDAFHEAATDRARRAALARDHHTCRWCRVRGPEVVAHVWRQPPILPSYRTELLVSLCPACHDYAHTAHVRTAECPPELAAELARHAAQQDAEVVATTAGVDDTLASQPDVAAGWEERDAGMRLLVPLAYRARRPRGLS